MCGIAGLFGYPLDDKKKLNELLVSIGIELEHRGPDNLGIWVDHKSEIALVHRRLSILDLTDNGNQPMISNSGRYALIFNGEIYNHLEIRKHLLNLNPLISFKGFSDTETLISCIDILGIKKTLGLLSGMFSIAIWDLIDEELILIRDRIGEKPLYYAFFNNNLIFASELKSFKLHPYFNRVYDLSSIELFLKSSFIPAPLTIYKGVSKLLPGHYLVVKKINGCLKSSLTQYWSYKKTVVNSKSKLIINPLFNAIEIFDNILNKVISEQMISDVEIGTFLSGGVDSSLVTAIMQNQSTKPINTFTIGFSNKDFDESHHALKIAKYLGTNHNVLLINDDDLINIASNLCNINDEPFADSSQIPTYFLSKLAKIKVKVCLTGDGADELFCGYNRYLKTYQYWKFLNLIPVHVKKIILLILKISKNKYSKTLIKKIYLLIKNENIHNFDSYISKIELALLSPDLYSFYNNLIGFDSGDISSNDFYTIDNELNDFINEVEKMMVCDALNYLPNDVLYKVDRTAMYNSLETRAPFLDNRIIDFAWQLPLSYKISKGLNKYIVRKLLEQYIPKNLIQNQKKGFTAPIDIWLRGPLNNWAENLLSKINLHKYPFLDRAELNKIWVEHNVNLLNNGKYLWNILMLISWIENDN